MGPYFVFHPFLPKTSNDNTNRLNFGYYFVIAGKTNMLSYLFTFKNINATPKMIFLPYCVLHVLHRNWGKFKNDKRAKLYEDIMSAPLDIFSMSLRRMDLQRILVREHTMHLQLFYLIGTKTILSMQRFRPLTDSLKK